MAVSASKTFVGGQPLLASELNALQAVYTSTAGQSVSFPRTAAAAMAGQDLTLDSNGTSLFRGSTNNTLRLLLNAIELYTWDGTVSSPVNGIKYVAKATGTAPTIEVQGDANRNLNLVPKGTGQLEIGGTIYTDSTDIPFANYVYDLG